MKTKSIKPVFRFTLVVFAFAYPIAIAVLPICAQGTAVQVIRLHETEDSRAVAPVSHLSGVSQSLTGSTEIQSSTAAPGKVNVKPTKPALGLGATVVHSELANLRDILLDVRRAMNAATNLYGEVTRHLITSYICPETMGPVMMEIPMPTFDMSEVLPARKRWVELYMGEISSIIAYVKSDLDEIQVKKDDLSVLPKDKDNFDKDLQNCTNSIERAVDYGNQLKKATIAPPYDNLMIAKLISPMHKELKEVEKTTKKLMGQIKKAQ